jgi:MEMO1 family protein
MTHVRPAAVAGSFYPGEPRLLQAAVLDFLGHHRPPPVAAGAALRFPKMLVVPHAGYVYSGDVAASAYALLAPWRGHIRRVVLLGPTHRVAVQGLAAPLAEAFETPLGRVRIDRAALAQLSGLPQLVLSDRPHALEHALEVQLPFLQTVLGSDFSLLPLAVGEASAQAVDEVIERVWGGDETLIVISSDLSHYLSRAQARARDRHTAQRILGFASDLRGDEACGAMPLNGAMRAAQRHGLVPRLLDLRNSADTAGGDEHRVVGYGAIAFESSPQTPGLAAEPGADTDVETRDETGDDAGSALGRALLSSARAEIAGALGLPAAPAIEHPRLQQPGASFVTLHDRSGDLRGCVGQLQAQRPLGEDVRHNALAAAFSDRRFAPLSPAEWPGLQIEVSVLGPLQPLPRAAGFDDAAALLRPGIDGVVLAAGGRQATFLPQVWAQLPEPRDFLAALWRKAGLPPGVWDADVQLWRYQVSSFEEARDEARH